tara:strand:- start:308 stop:829 length:522 start_codon:yes stop_codon:yes gene_type:complete
MSILKIARLGHPILLKKAALVEDIESNKIKRIIRDMTETMIDSNGIGLAAPQVHISKQIMIFRDIENEEENHIKVNVLINPKIEVISKETNDSWEGCLSIPNMLGFVKRFTKIKYEGFDINGNLIKKEAEGMHARVVQHENDHLEGILYTSRLTNKMAYGFSEEIETYWKKNK